MTAPNTDVEKQAKRHAGPLIGISIGLIVVIVLFVVFTGNDEVAEEDATQIAPAEAEAAATDGG